jgi:hypothetical protein
MPSTRTMPPGSSRTANLPFDPAAPTLACVDASGGGAAAATAAAAAVTVAVAAGCAALLLLTLRRLLPAAPLLPAAALLLRCPAGCFLVRSRCCLVHPALLLSSLCC